MHSYLAHYMSKKTKEAHQYKFMHFRPGEELTEKQINKVLAAEDPNYVSTVEIKHWSRSKK